MTDRIPHLTQEQAAKLMFAHAKAVNAAMTRQSAANDTQMKPAARGFYVSRHKAAEAAFAELVSSITLHEAE